jgi:hypothetical protein
MAWSRAINWRSGRPLPAAEPLGDEVAVDLLEREVSATPAEYVRGLLDAFPGAVEPGPWGYRVNRGSAALDAAIDPGPERVIGGLRLPTVLVRIRLSGGDRAARGELLRRLDLATHRGGG